MHTNRKPHNHETTKHSDIASHHRRHHARRCAHRRCADRQSRHQRVCWMDVVLCSVSGTGLAHACSLCTSDSIDRQTVNTTRPNHAPDLRAVAGRNGKGDGIIMDIQPDILDNVPVSAFLSLFVLTTNKCGSALRHTPARNPRLEKADTLGLNIASHTD